LFEGHHLLIFRDVQMYQITGEPWGKMVLIISAKSK